MLRGLCALAAASFVVFSAWARPEIWLFLAPDGQADKSLVAASVAWLGESSGALVDSYFETYRDGALFATSGSSVISGRHFQDFNYLVAKADVKIVRYGKTCLFASSARNFGLETLAEAATAEELYAQILAKRPALAAQVKGFYTASDVPFKCYAVYDEAPAAPTFDTLVPGTTYRLRDVNSGLETVVAL